MNVQAFLGADNPHGSQPGPWSDLWIQNGLVRSNCTSKHMLGVKSWLLLQARLYTDLCLALLSMLIFTER